MELIVESLGGDAHRITVRGHRVVVDQPVDAGGGDAGPTHCTVHNTLVQPPAVHFEVMTATRGAGAEVA